MRLSKEIKDFREKCRAAEQVSNLIGKHKEELNVYGSKDPENMMGFWGGVVFKIDSFDKLKDKIALLHRIFPGIERKEVSSWSPYDDCVIAAWKYVYKGIKLDIWLELTVDEVPQLYANGVLSPTCSFQAEEKKQYVLVCKATEVVA